MSREKYANSIKEFASDLLSYAMYMEDKECVPNESEVSNIMLDIIKPELHFYQEICGTGWFKPAHKKYIEKARDVIGVDRTLLEQETR